MLRRYKQYLSLRRVLQHVCLHRIERVRCVSKTPWPKVFVKLRHKAVALGITRQLDRHAAVVVRRGRWRGAKLANAQSTQPGQSRPTQLKNHAADFAFRRKR